VVRPYQVWGSGKSNHERPRTEIIRVKLRKQSLCIVAAVSVIAAITCAHSRAWFSSFALLACAAFAIWKLREPVPRIDNLKDWLIALEGKDPFNPDAKPTYLFSGFVTTFLVALQIKDHPLLTGKTLFVFRDELEDRDWRTLVTRVRHGPHTHSAREASPRVE
jgi:hypothetical protein